MRSKEVSMQVKRMTTRVIRKARLQRSGTNETINNLFQNHRKRKMSRKTGTAFDPKPPPHMSNELVLL